MIHTWPRKNKSRKYERNHGPIPGVHPPPTVQKGWRIVRKNPHGPKNRWCIAKPRVISGDGGPRGAQRRSCSSRRSFGRWKRWVGKRAGAKGSIFVGYDRETISYPGHLSKSHWQPPPLVDHWLRKWSLGDVNESRLVGSPMYENKNYVNNHHLLGFD